MKTQQLRIDLEHDADASELYRLIKEAFLHAEHRDGNEQDLAAALWKDPACVRELCLTAKLGSRIVGHIMYSKCEISGTTCLCLAPVAVLPKYQGQGIGSALISLSLQWAAQRGYPWVIVVGGPYYSRFGFKSAALRGIEAPEGIPEEFFWALKLNPEAPKVSGPVAFAAPFML